MIQKGLQSPGITFADTYENLNALIDNIDVRK